MKNVHYMLVLLVVSLIFPGCEKDDPFIPNEEELITTLVYTLTPQNDGETVVFSFQSLGDDPVIIEGALTANTVYDGAILLLNELESPIVDITKEVEEEGDEHQFFFIATIPGLTVAYADKDDDEKPIGISTTLSTGTAGVGNLTIVLRHMPDKSALGVAQGDMTNAGGETDIEVTFDVNVQ